MGKTILIQQIYPNLGYISLLSLTFKRHVLYCEKYNIDYSIHVTEIMPAECGGWDKVKLVQRYLSEDYDLVIWLDADATIWNLDRDINDVPNPVDTIGAVRFDEFRNQYGKIKSPAHYNVGALYFRNGDNVKEFVNQWLNNYPGKSPWHEQQVFNDISDNVFQLPDEYNYTVDRHSGNDNPIVKGYHSIRGLEKKYEAMKKDLEKINFLKLK